MTKSQERISRDIRLKIMKRKYSLKNNRLYKKRRQIIMNLQIENEIEHNGIIEKKKVCKENKKTQ